MHISKRSSVVLILVSILLPQAAWTKIIATTLAPAGSGTELLVAYKKKFSNSSNGPLVLDAAFARGVAATSSNILMLRDLLASSIPPQEKAPLLRILGSLHTYNNSTKLNLSIESDLRSATNSGSQEIARAATLAYSRLGYSSDFDTVMASARSRKLVSEDEYFGEYAQIVPSAPRDVQLGMVKKIAAGRNSYAVEILADLLSNPAMLAQFYPEARAELQTMLEKLEPSFPLAIGEYGLIDGMRYSTSLQAIALLSAAKDGTSYVATVLSRLEAPETDPRKVIAYFSSSEGKRMMKDLGSRNRLEPLFQRAHQYSESFPQNQVTADLVRGLDSSLSQLSK